MRLLVLIASCIVTGIVAGIGAYAFAQGDVRNASMCVGFVAGNLPMGVMAAIRAASVDTPLPQRSTK